MRQLIKDAIKIIKENKEKFIYVDSKGKVLKLEEAAKKGIPVTPVDVRHKALGKLKEKGIDLLDGPFRKDLQELIDLVGGTNHSHKPIALNAEGLPKKVYNKDEILEKWFEYAMEEENASAEEFADHHHIGYQTLAKWINDVKPR
ncbi:hypothetical protein QWY93_16125 [Echinicola jeungdonensis]|uniref:Uncharacterized protein n=1 Tax=Echinicola jeungdonensis TaxID=709343 RepID=A0ABV5J5C6_9BACT|nr:hypothetical protein [Echinicola jeungdonensis]MDN3670849.1 hypothetical protein [Echinicola jeungdonensis]